MSIDIFAGASGPGFPISSVGFPSASVTGATAIIAAANSPNRPVVEPPPSGYPKIITHPERPTSPFYEISDGLYRSPTGETVTYRTVADYVLTAQGIPRATLMTLLGQDEPKFPLALLIGAGALVLLVLIKK